MQNSAIAKVTVVSSRPARLDVTFRSILMGTRHLTCASKFVGGAGGGFPAWSGLG